MELGVARIPHSAADDDQDGGDYELDAEGLARGYAGVGQGNAEPSAHRKCGRGKQDHEQAVADEGAQHLGGEVGKCHAQGDHLVDVGGHGHGGIQMGTGDAAKALDGDEDGEAKVQHNLQMVVGKEVRLHATHAAQEDQDAGADELAEEGGDFVQRRSLHFEDLTATEMVREALE